MEIVGIILVPVVVICFTVLTIMLGKNISTINSKYKEKYKKISFKKKYIDIGLPIITIKILENEYDFIVDTGANFNALDKTQFRRIVLENNLNLNLSTSDDNGDVTVIGVGGTQQHIKDVNIEISIDDVKMEEEFSLVDIKDALKAYSKNSHSLCGVLGSSFLERHKWQIDFKELIFLIKNESII